LYLVLRHSSRTMPSRKKDVKAPPKFSFVPLAFGAEDKSWLKIHSGAARSHAAYWGGPAKSQRHRQVHGDNKEAEPANLKASKATTSLSETACFPHGLESLPRIPASSIPLEIDIWASQFPAALLVSKFCGEEFVRRFVLGGLEDDSLMLSGLVLLSYAHSMALTGHGSKTRLLGLKGQVIRRISTKMKASDGLLDPGCLTAILALGSSIVCLVSQELPNSLTVLEYIRASMQDDCLCCQASADKAQSALDERMVHQQAMQRLLLRSKVSFKDPDSLALLQYVSNCINMQVSRQTCHSISSNLQTVQWPLTQPIS
jgi:hypothetical protein